MSDNENTKEQLDVLVAMERIAEIGQQITNSLSEHSEIYVADGKLVMNFSEFGNDRTGVEQLKKCTNSFTTYLVLKRYSKNEADLEISIPNNEALFIRIDAKYHSAALSNFQVMSVPTNLIFELRFSGEKSIQLPGEFYFSFEDHIND